MEFYNRSIFIIVRHFQLAIQIYHHSLSPTLCLSTFSTFTDYYSSNSLRIDTFLCPVTLWCCKADFVELQEAPRPLPAILPAHCDADKLLGQLKFFFLSFSLCFLLLFNQVVQLSYPFPFWVLDPNQLPAFACFIANWRQSEKCFW